MFVLEVPIDGFNVESSVMKQEVNVQQLLANWMDNRQITIEREGMSIKRNL